MTDSSPIQDLTYDRASGEYRLRRCDDRKLTVDIALVLAEIADEDPLEMEPLYYSVDPGLLDRLSDARTEVSFTYRDYHVTVDEDRNVTIRPD